MNKAGGASATRGTPLEPSPRPARTHQGTAGAPDSSRAQRIFHKSPARQVTSLGDARHAGASGCLAGTSLDASLRSYGMRRTVFGPIARFKDASPVAVSQERCNNRHGAPSGWGPLFAAHPPAARPADGRGKAPLVSTSERTVRAAFLKRRAARFSVRRTLLNKSRRDGFRCLREKRASPTLFAFGVREEASLRVRGGLSAAACCRALDTAALCPYISWESRSARVGRHVLRGGFASGTSRRRELGAHGAG
jgi:hypothetical protein